MPLPAISTQSTQACSSQEEDDGADAHPTEDKYQKMMRELRETRERASQTLARSAVLKVEIAQAMQKSQEVDAKFDKFKSDFNDVMA